MKERTRFKDEKRIFRSHSELLLLCLDNLFFNTFYINLFWVFCVFFTYCNFIILFLYKNIDLTLLLLLRSLICFFPLFYYILFLSHFVYLVIYILLNIFFSDFVNFGILLYNFICICLLFCVFCILLYLFSIFGKFFIQFIL